MDPLLALVALPLLLFVPGFLTLGRGFFSPIAAIGAGDGMPDIRPRHPDLIEAIGLCVAGSFFVSSVAVAVLVMVGAFSLWLLLVVVGVYSVEAATLPIVAGRGSRWPRLPRPATGEAALAATVMVLFCLAVLLYSRYSETVLLIRDPATYTNTAVNISESGGSPVQDDLYYSLDEPLQKALVYERPVDSEAGRFGGFQAEYRLRGFFRDQDSGHTLPQFLNLFPGWQAVGHSLFGVPGAFLVSPLMGGLSLLMVFLLGRRVFGTVAGASAALLLSVNLGQLWYARTPASEVTFQFTFVAAALFWVLFATWRQPAAAALAGVGFGLLAFIRVDSAVVFLGGAMVLLYLGATHRLGRRDLAFLAPLAGVMVLALVDATRSSHPYLSLLYRSSPSQEALLGLGAAAGLAATVAAAPGAASMLWRAEDKYRGWALLGLGIVLVGVAAFAYFGRPELQDTIKVNMVGSTIRTYSEESFVRLGWYVTPLGLALATAGAALALARARTRGLGLVLAAGLLTAMYYLYDPRITPDHFWAARRQVLMSIPLSSLFIGLCLQTIGWRRMPAWSPEAANVSDRHPGRLALRMDRTLGPLWGARALSGPRWLVSRVDGRIVALALFGAVAGLSVHQIWDFVGYREQEGSVEAVEGLASRFPEDSVIVFEQSGMGQLLAPPLKIIHGLDAFVMGPPGASDSYRNLCGVSEEYPSDLHPTSCILARLTEATSDRPLFWVSSGTGRQPKVVREKFQRLKGARFAVDVPKMEQPTTNRPKRSLASPLVLTGQLYLLDRSRLRALVEASGEATPSRGIPGSAGPP